MRTASPTYSARRRTDRSNSRALCVILTLARRLTFQENTCLSTPVCSAPYPVHIQRPGWHQIRKDGEGMQTRSDGSPIVIPTGRSAPPSDRHLYSHDPERDGKLLRQYGYALIGTTSFYGADDLPYAKHAAAQGQKVRAGIVLLNVRYYSVGGDAPLGNPVRGATYFSSYWAKSDAAKTSEPQ